MTGEPLRCLVFPHEVGDGPRNMALDEVLLELAAADPPTAAFRTYGWTEPTLSLGYFQHLAKAEADPRWASRPLVRRPTGGGAIWHDREITYALALPRAHSLYRQNTELYRRVHATIAAMLKAAGVSASRRGEAAARPADGARPLLCFVDRDAEDLVVGHEKIVGSAQRRRSGAILQHGSILLETSPATPELPGARDLAASTKLDAAWCDMLRRSIPASLGLVAVEAGWSVDQRRRADKLAMMTYRAAEWTRRR